MCRTIPWRFRTSNTDCACSIDEMVFLMDLSCHHAGGCRAAGSGASSGRRGLSKGSHVSWLSNHSTLDQIFAVHLVNETKQLLVTHRQHGLNLPRAFAKTLQTCRRAAGSIPQSHGHSWSSWSVPIQGLSFESARDSQADGGNFAITCSAAFSLASTSSKSQSSRYLARI